MAASQVEGFGSHPPLGLGLLRFEKAPQGLQEVVKPDFRQRKCVEEHTWTPAELSLSGKRPNKVECIFAFAKIS